MEQNVVQKQMEKMIDFMEMEARERVEKIDAKAEEDFTIEKGNAIMFGKQKINKELEIKEKRENLQSKIDTSEMLNQARLRILREKDDHVKTVLEEAMSQLGEYLADKKLYSSILRSLLTEAMCQILEPVVMVRCRKKDMKMLKKVIPEALFEYEAKVNKYCKVQVDTDKWVDEDKLGGLEISALGGKIFVDNTLKARIERIYLQMMPMVRKNLFADAE